MKQFNNKQLVTAFYAKVFGQADKQFAEATIAPDYIQHNPMVKNGKAGFMEFLNFLEQVPPPENPSPPFMRFISEGNLVAVHSEVEWMGQKNATVDVHRIENGMFVEHWDASQKIIDGSPAVAGTTTIDQKEATEISKTLVVDFIRSVFIDQQMDKADKLISDNISMKDFETSYKQFTLLQVIAEHNFVVTQAKVERADTSYARYDVFRISDDKLVEHWVVEQAIPEEMAHNNGML